MIKEEGLSSIEAQKRLKKYGFNEIKDITKISAFQILLRQIKKNFVIYLLFVAMSISFFVGKYITAYTILVIIFLVIIVGFLQEYRAEKAIQALKKMIMPVSIVIRDGREIEIPSKEIVPSDILILRNGEKIPADCLILKEKDLLVNESVLTGESTEIKKEAAKSLRNYSDKNLLFMGSFIVNGKNTAIVLHTGMNTKFGKIAGMISVAEKELPLQAKINKITKFMALTAIIIAFLTGAAILFISSSNIVDILILVIAIAVSAFPEGFPVVLITTLSIGAYRMAKKNAIVNRMSIIETLGETTVICADKTGTITKGEMTANKIYADNTNYDVSGSGYEVRGDFLLNGRKINALKDAVLSKLLTAVVSCNDALIKRTGEDNIYSIIGSPTESALLIMAGKSGLFKEDLKSVRIEEIPFSSEKKMMSVLYKQNKESYVYSKGAVEILLKKCKFIQRNNGIFRLLDKDREKIMLMNKKMTSNSLRVIAVAYKPSKTTKNLEEELIFLGLIGMEDPPREEVKDALALCNKAGIKVKMITGDNKETAVSIAKQIGLKGEVIEGDELDKMTFNELTKVVQNIVIFARVRPEHKLRIVKALKQNKEIVTMTGDGVNDAPALKEAHIGVAMGKSGTDVSRSVADLTLKDDNFATIVDAVKEGRTIFNNMRKFTTYQLSCNYAELGILFFGVLLTFVLGWPVPVLLALHILFMNIVTDNLPAITLGLSKSSDDIMEEKPRKKQGILNKNLLILLGLSGTLMMLFTLIVFFITFNIFNESVEYARTTALVTLIMVEIAGAFNFRSFRKGVLNRSPFVNPYLFFASLISIIATIVIIYTPANRILDTLPIPFVNWAIAIGIALLLIIIFDVIKAVNKRKKFWSENSELR